MASASADAREVDEAIKIGEDVVAAEVGIDESELEEELLQLVKESEREREDEAVNKLGEGRMNVPDHLPSDAVIPQPSGQVLQRQAEPA